MRGYLKHPVAMCYIINLTRKCKECCNMIEFTHRIMPCDAARERKRYCDTLTTRTADAFVDKKFCKACPKPEVSEEVNGEAGCTES